MQVTADAFAISRKGGQVLFKLPLDCLLTAAQPNPTSLEVQLSPDHALQSLIASAYSILAFAQAPNRFRAAAYTCMHSS
jgi:hypothetical protein